MHKHKLPSDTNKAYPHKHTHCATFNTKTSCLVEAKDVSNTQWMNVFFLNYSCHQWILRIPQHRIAVPNVHIQFTEKSLFHMHAPIPI